MICTEDMQTSRRVHQIVKLKERRQQNAAKARDADKRLADRLRQLQAEEAKRERKRETRRKIVIGAIVRAAQMSETEISLGWLEAKIHALERPDDRAPLRSRSREPSAEAAERGQERAGGLRRSPPGRRSCWPSSSRSIRGIARQVGVDPDEPGLEALGQSEGGFADPGGARPRQPADAAR